jgi:serine/threonine protein kinase
LGLEYLQTKCIAHRDVRSDNLLLNRDGVLKISQYFLCYYFFVISLLRNRSADFSSAVKVTPENPMCSEPAGVIYWQVRIPISRMNDSSAQHAFCVGTGNANVIFHFYSTPCCQS